MNPGSRANCRASFSGCYNKGIKNRSIFRLRCACVRVCERTLRCSTCRGPKFMQHNRSGTGLIKCYVSHVQESFKMWTYRCCKLAVGTFWA